MLCQMTYLQKLPKFCKINYGNAEVHLCQIDPNGNNNRQFFTVGPEKNLFSVLINSLDF